MVEIPVLQTLDPGSLRRPLPTNDLMSENPDYNKVFASMTERIRDVSKLEPSPQDSGVETVQLDSLTNVQYVRPIVHLMYAGFNQLPELQTIRDTVYQEILHIPIHDPYLGLAGVLLPGTPQ